ncbi:MAG: 3-phosphoshikimate 1-carboxyvinyltransferase [Ilumatobacteraceae bacterium]
MTVLHLPGRQGPIDAVVPVPGSKSVANRALVCAALAGGGESRVTNVPGGDDCAAMMDALRTAGCLTVDGAVRGGVFPGPATLFDAGLAGTTSRFLMAASSLSPSGVVIDGDDPLRRRPMADLADALRRLGATVEHTVSPGHLPLRVQGGPHVRGGHVGVRGDVSSQFISALMLVAPRLADGLVIAVDGTLVSRPYVEMTASVMRAFGADATVAADEVRVPPGGYAPTDYEVEPDFSSAAFPLMALAFTEGRVTVKGLRRARLQGDSFVLEVARSMGLRVSDNGDDVVVERAAASRLAPVDVDLRDASDLVPAVAVACAAIDGTSTIRGVGFIRNKESDRIGDLVSCLRGIGAVAHETDDGLTIEGGRALECRSAVPTHHDHRLAMAFSLPAAGGISIIIEDPSVVTKSWPGYFADMVGVLGPASTAN